MPAYIIASYDIADPEGYAPYVPSVFPLLQKHNAEVLVGDFEAKALEGEAQGVNVVLKFESEEAAMKWYNDPAYEPVRKIRLDSTKNRTLLLTKEFVLPLA
jgi:uncharacterized protein (DUF1330 family)